MIRGPQEQRHVAQPCPRLRRVEAPPVEVVHEAALARRHVPQVVHHHARVIRITPETFVLELAPEQVVTVRLTTSSGKEVTKQVNLPGMSRLEDALVWKPDQVTHPCLSRGRSSSSTRRPAGF